MCSQLKTLNWTCLKYLHSSEAEKSILSISIYLQIYSRLRVTRMNSFSTNKKWLPTIPHRKRFRQGISSNTNQTSLRLLILFNISQNIPTHPKVMSAFTLISSGQAIASYPTFEIVCHNCRIGTTFADFVLRERNWKQSVSRKISEILLRQNSRITKNTSLKTYKAIICSQLTYGLSDPPRQFNQIEQISCALRQEWPSQCVR